MIPIPANTLKRLRLEAAIHDEAQSWQSLIPPPPGLEQIETDVQIMAKWPTSRRAKHGAARGCFCQKNITRD